jgi:hypothetical protein
MAWVAIGATAVSMAGNAYMSNKAEDAQYASSQQGLGLLSSQNSQVRDDTRTQRKVGEQAMGKLADMLGIARPGPKKPDKDDYSKSSGYSRALTKYKTNLAEFNNRPTGANAWQQDPGYQFRLDNTNKTIDRYQSAGKVKLD